MIFCAQRAIDMHIAATDRAERAARRMIFCSRNARVCYYGRPVWPSYSEWLVPGTLAELEVEHADSRSVWLG